MTEGNWGGSAGGGGYAFQAAVSAVCMVHMARTTALRWCESISDIPVSVSAESGGAGDDIALQLVDGGLLEVQAKHRLKADAELWETLIALCGRAHADAAFHGVVAVGPLTSERIRNQLARDIIRLGQGRTDDLSPLAVTLAEKLAEAGLPLSVCAKVRIQALHVLEQDGASVQAALAHLAHVSAEPESAWERLKDEGLQLIRLRGRRDVASLAGIIPGLRASTTGPFSAVVVAQRLLDWTLNTTSEFTIPAVDTTFSLDADWIELKAAGGHDVDVISSNLEEALTRYHAGAPRMKARHERDDEFDAETLGYFVRQCVIVAGPGMGKTLLLRRIARLLARKKQPALIVRLRPLAERMRTGEAFLDGLLRGGLDASGLSAKEVSSLGLQNLTFLLDGLDESSSEQEVIAEGAIALAASFPRCRIVFTTRHIGYETALLAKWRHYELIPIESSDAKRGLERLVTAAAGDASPKLKESTAAAIQHLDYRRDQRFEARSPLLIAILASLALNEVLAAGTREGLYGQLFTLIERVGASKRYNTTVPPPVLNAFLQHLGWELAAHRTTDVDRALAACANYLSHELGELPLRARSVCAEALAFWEAAGIVERVRFKATEALTFVHKTFGEYAAARHLASRDQGERASLLKEIEPANPWSEVAVFASALGLGEDLVRLAEASESGDGRELKRALRWARHSRDVIDSAIAETVARSAWAIIVGSHSRRALDTGRDLLTALDKLPGAGDFSRRYHQHPQWWTALVGWSCLARHSPVALDYSALLAFMDSYAANSDTRKLGGGLDLFDPEHELWEELLLSAAREAARRGLAGAEQEFINRLQQSLDARSMRFVGDLTHILKGAGVEVKFPQHDFASRFFGPEYFEQSRADMIALLEAINWGPTGAPVRAEPPLLHLSAFFHGTALMKLSPAAAFASKSFGGAAREIVALAARHCSEDHAQLIGEGRAKIGELKGPDSLLLSFKGIVSVDAPSRWGEGTFHGMTGLFAEGLEHPSEWIVYLAANLMEHHCPPDEIAKLIPATLSGADGLGMAAAAYLTIKFLGNERARDLMVARLKQPLNDGCKHLYHYLSSIWDKSLEPQLADLLRPALRKGPRTAEASLELVRVCSEQQRKALASLLKEAYSYWLEAEDPYPTGGGVIPPSPRGEILKVLIEDQVATLEELFTAVQDARSDVASAARSELLQVCSSSEAARKELLQRADLGEAVHAVLADCLRGQVAFSKQEVEAAARLLEASRAEIRHAALGILAPHYLELDEIEHWARKLLEDPYQHIRDTAYERLLAIGRTPCGAPS